VHFSREPRRHACAGSAGVNAASRVALSPWRELIKASLYWGEALGHSIAVRCARPLDTASSSVSLRRNAVRLLADHPMKHSLLVPTLPAWTLFNRKRVPFYPVLILRKRSWTPASRTRSKGDAPTWCVGHVKDWCRWVT
jgi:hypothetical protein